MGKVNARVQQSPTRLNPKHEQSRPADNRNGGDHTGGDEPPGGADMEARVAKLETHFEHIRRDLNDVASDVRELRTEVHEEFKAVRTEMREEFKAIRTEMREDFKEVHEEFKAVRTEIREEFKEVRKEMREDLRIMFGGLVLVALGLATLSAKGFGWL